MDANGFLLGTHEEHWVGRAAVPWFISRNRLVKKDNRAELRRTLPRAVDGADVGLDSGGFTEIQRFGEWTISPVDYVRGVKRCAEEMGRIRWAAPMDWMCEPIVRAGGTAGGQRFVGTGLSVEEHQRRSTWNLVELRDLAVRFDLDPMIFPPSAQGWEPWEYARHVEIYAAAGIDLTREPLVCVGSVCRRQDTDAAGQVLTALHEMGVKRLHGFGFKVLGLKRFGHLLTSADSLAWSFRARRSAPMPGHTHKSCANCLEFALQWRTRIAEEVLS